jgi:hypothetical protein
MKPRRQGPRPEYALDLSSVNQPPERLAILIGDYLFNVRSALDHLMVAIAHASTAARSAFLSNTHALPRPVSYLFPAPKG